MPANAVSPSPLRFRSWIALGLVFGYYALSIAVAAGLLFLTYLALTQLDTINIKAVIFCPIAAGTILWSILPRFERFEPPGPVVRRELEPRLFQEIERIARRCNQPMPHTVYLAGDMNAGVLQHGGFLGIGRRSALIIGLPLVCATTVSQLRAVLAHEFGHFCSGDTKLEPWIYRTTKAIARTMTLLDQRRVNLAFLFEWYGALFLRMTRSISRHQEFAADALGARLAGPRAMREGLIVTVQFQLHRVSHLFWNNYMRPALNAGFRPSFAGGFQQFISDDWHRTLVTNPVAARTEDVYDTHPPLQQRIAALESLPPGDAPVLDSPALALFEHLDELEEQLINLVQKPEAKLTPIAWENVGRDVSVPQWARDVQRQARALSGITPASLPNIKNLTEFWDKLRDPSGRLLVRGDRQSYGLWILATGLALALYRQGWQLHDMPGEFYLRKNGVTISPFEDVRKLFDGEITAENWLEQCTRAGISQIDFPQASASAAGAGN
jgi:Zn-dependent protease with chaperone function